MKWLIDTNVLSETIRPRPDPNVLEWVAAQELRDTAISIISLAELVEGAASAHNHDRRTSLTEWIEKKVKPDFSDRTLTLTVEILCDWLSLARQLRAKGKSKAAPDLIVASTARIHELTIVSRNIQHFADCGVAVFNPWTGQTHYLEKP